MSSVVPLLLTSALGLSSVLSQDNVFLRGCDETATSDCDRHIHEMPVETNIETPPIASGVKSCIPDDNGSFGITMGPQQEIEFFYQVEAAVGVDMSDMNNAILGDVEKKISSILLPSILPEQCGASGGRRRQRKLGATGVSTLEQDVVLFGGAFTCTGVVEENNPCFVVDGFVTVYYQDGKDAGEFDNLAATLRGTVEGAMNNGSLDGVHDQIVKVSFRSEPDIESFSQTTESQEENAASTNSDSGTDLSWLWALLGSLGVLGLAWLGLWCLRRRTNRRKMESALTEAEEDTPVSDENGDPETTDENGETEAPIPDDNKATPATKTSDEKGALQKSTADETGAPKTQAAGDKGAPERQAPKENGDP